MATMYSKISREKKLLFKQLKKEGHPMAFNEAGRLINLKYGKGWRVQYGCTHGPRHMMSGGSNVTWMEPLHTTE